MTRIYFDTRPDRFAGTSFAGQRTPLENPWFVSLASRPRMCPCCHGTTVWEGTMDPDAAYESCPKCGWFHTQLAPPEFEGKRCAPVGEESAIPVDLGMDEARRASRLARAVGDDPPKRGEVIEFRPRA